MTDRRYKGYTIRQVGLSHYVFSPGAIVPDVGYAGAAEKIVQSMAAAKRWINVQEERAQVSQEQFEDACSEADARILQNPRLYGW